MGEKKNIVLGRTFGQFVTSRLSPSLDLNPLNSNLMFDHLTR